MRRRIISAAIVSCLAGAAALAGDQLAFDSIGSMMLEHEAEENIDGASMASSTRSSDRSYQISQCEQDEAALQARLKELEASFSQSSMPSVQDIKALKLDAIKAKTHEMTAKLKAMELEREGRLYEVRAVLAARKTELAKYRSAFKDQALLQKVEKALAKAERALAAD